MPTSSPDWAQVLHEIVAELDEGAMNFLDDRLSLDTVLDRTELNQAVEARLDDRTKAAQAALSLEKALQPIRMDAFRDKVRNILAEIFQYADYEAGGDTINEYAEKIIRAY